MNMERPQPKHEISDGEPVTKFLYYASEDARVWLLQEGATFGECSHDPVRHRITIAVSPCWDCDAVLRYLCSGGVREATDANG